MYFRNKFNEEFLYLADNILPKGGSVRLNQSKPLFFEIKRPAFDEEGRLIEVIPLLLYNRIESTNQLEIEEGRLRDKNVEDWIMLCQNRKDTVVTCWYDEQYISQQETDYICDMNIVEVTGDLDYDPDYNYEDV